MEGWPELMQVWGVMKNAVSTAWTVDWLEKCSRSTLTGHTALFIMAVDNCMIAINLIYGLKLSN